MFADDTKCFKVIKDQDDISNLQKCLAFYFSLGP